MTELSNNQIRLSVALIWVCALVVSAFVVMNGVGKYITYKGFDECSKMARYEKKNPDGSFVSYPIAEMYEKCLKDKGLKGSVK